MSSRNSFFWQYFAIAERTETKADADEPSPERYGISLKTVSSAGWSSKTLTAAFSRSGKLLVVLDVVAASISMPVRNSADFTVYFELGTSVVKLYLEIAAFSTSPPYSLMNGSTSVPPPAKEMREGARDEIIMLVL